ncbi:hypothetical protein FRC00_006914 [Tulasnella sp. 408]|nr:hypothetical protein FRC00_006914 [Tulasnella sp. 408]
MAKLKVEVPQFHDIVLDDEDRFYRKLESLSNLLGLLGHVFHRVELLDIMRTLCMRTSFSGKIDSFVLTSVAIAQEYVKIGKLDRAAVTYEQAASSPCIDVRNVTTEVRVIFLLRWAEALALTECTDEALLKYGEAMALSEVLTVPDKTAPTIVRARSRITALERSALAATVYGAIQLSRDNTTTAISGLMQALRLWNRALDTLTKLRQPALPASSSSPNPFQVSAQDQAISTDDKPGSPRLWDAMIDGLHWRLADGVVTTLFALGRLHHIRGSVKNSEFFTQKANELATSLNAPLLISRALAKEAEKELAIGHLDTGHDLLVQASYHWEQGPDVLDVSAAVTLRREMLECIDNKFPNISQANDLAWPTMNVNGSPHPASHAVAQGLMFAQDSDEDDEDDEETDMQAYWQMVKKRYRSETLDAAGLACPMVDLLPEHWTVVNISVTDDKQTLFISRQRARCEPLIFCLPLDRQGRREMGDDEEEPLSYEKAIEELQDIIRLNDETAKNAKDIQDKEGRAAWWAERGNLDLRLKELLENIEFCWLGAFKTILAEPSDSSVEALNSLRTKIDKVFKRNRVVPQDKKSHLRLRLDDAIVECFSNLSPKCRDEEIEDLIYFVLDLYQLHGAPIALSEIDMDQLVVDLRTVLEEYSAKSRGESTAHPDHHLFLALDKNLQGLPWESIPILRGRSVSRIPSISFLLDRVDLVRHQQGQALASRSSTGGPPPDRTTVDPLKTFYILNPSGDLKNTQSTFEPKFKDLEKLGWKGITGRPPTEEEMLQGFQRNDLVLPTLVANLWDVTDREIDRVATAVLSKLRIDGEHLDPKGKSTSGDASAVSVVQAVAEARELCKLKYLTGAAPVVYGIPFYL